MPPSPFRTTSVLREAGRHDRHRETEAAEFSDIYKLDVLPILTNRPNQREDLNDQVFKTRREKYNAVIAKIQEAHEKDNLVLAGTASVDASETVSRMLKRAKIPHTVLNAKMHMQEAEIIAAAGQRGGHHLHQHGGPGHRH